MAQTTKAKINETMKALDELRLQVTALTNEAIDNDQEALLMTTFAHKVAQLQALMIRSSKYETIRTYIARMSTVFILDTLIKESGAEDDYKQYVNIEAVKESSKIFSKYTSHEEG